MTSAPATPRSCPFPTPRSTRPLRVRLDVRAQPRPDRPRDRPRHPTRRTIALASWTPDGFLGALFRTVARFAPPPAGVASPMLWGTADHLASLFGPHVHWTHTTETFTFRFPTAEAFVDYFAQHYGPTLKAIGPQATARSSFPPSPNWHGPEPTRQHGPSRSPQPTWPLSASERQTRPRQPAEARETEELMFHPVNVPDLMRRTLNGAFAKDPTIPYSPGRPQRLAGTLRWIARRPDRDTHLSRARERTQPMAAEHNQTMTDPPDGRRRVESTPTRRWRRSNPGLSFDIHALGSGL